MKRFLVIISIINFLFSLYPTVVAQTITTGTLTGIISSCSGMASANPDILQFTVSGNNLTGDITATASANFEVSLVSNSNYSNMLTLAQSGGTVNSAVIYVRSSSSAPSGSISGIITLSSSGATSQNVSVVGTINVSPTVDMVNSQTVLKGTATLPVNFTGTGNTFNWVNDTPGIGLAANGTGNIASFIAVNNGTAPLTANITVTPENVGYAYIPNQYAGTVSVVNTVTNTVVATITVGQTPTGVTISPDGSTVYVTNQTSNTISVINTSTKNVTATITLGKISPTGVAISPDGKTLYVVGLNSNTVVVINTTTNAITGGIQVGAYPIAVAISRDGSNLYITNSSNSVSAFNFAKSSITNIPVANGPYGIAVSPDANKVYVANSGAQVLTIIDATSNMVISTIPMGTNPVGVAVSPDGERVYVTNESSNTVSVLNTLTNSVTTIPVGLNPFGVSVSQDDSKVYVADQGSNSVSVIDAASNTVEPPVMVEFGPEALGNFVTGGSGCTGMPVTFTITVDATALPPVITATGVLPAFNTTYGMPSLSASFNVSGANLTSGILVSPPPGFEVSSDNINFGNKVTIGGAGSVALVPVYIRLAAITPFGTYSGNIVLSTAGAANVNVPVANCAVNSASLTIIADNKTKNYYTENPVLTATYKGFVNNENQAALTIQPKITTTATLTSPIGKYLIMVSGAVDTNYNITYVSGTLSVVAYNPPIIIPSAFTPNGDGINDTWDIKNIENYPKCTVEIYNRYGEKLYSSIGYATPWDGKYKGAYLPAGTYYYIIDPKNSSSVISGYVAIIK